MWLLVKMLNGALHYSNSDIGFSLCAVSNYLVLVSEYFGCVLRTPRILEVSEMVWEFRSKSRTGVLSRERGA